MAEELESINDANASLESIDDANASLTSTTEEKKKDISQSSSVGGTSESMASPSAYAPRSIGEIKQQNAGEVQLDKSKILKERIAKDLPSMTPNARKVYLKTLAGHDYDIKALEDYATSLKLPDTRSEQEKKFDSLSTPETQKGAAEMIQNAEHPGFVGELVNDATEGTKAGAKQVLGAVKNIAQTMQYDDKSMGTKLKDLGTGVLNVGAGAAKGAFAAAGAVAPELMAFNAGTKALTKMPEDAKKAIMSGLSPSLATAPAETSAKEFDKIIELPFTLATSIAEASGYKPKEGSAGLAALEILNLLIPIGAAKAPGAYKKFTANEFTDIANKIGDGTATSEETKAYVAVSKGMEDLTPQEIQDAAKEQIDNAPVPHDELQTKLAELQAEKEKEGYSNLPQEVKAEIEANIETVKEELIQKHSAPLEVQLQEAKDAAEITGLDEKIAAAETAMETAPQSVKEAIQKSIDDLKGKKAAIEKSVQDKKQLTSDEMEERDRLSFRKESGTATKDEILRLDEINAKAEVSTKSSIKESTENTVTSQKPVKEVKPVVKDVAPSEVVSAEKTPMTEEKQAFIDNGIKELKKSGDYDKAFHNIYEDTLHKKHDILKEKQEDEVRNQPKVDAIRSEAENADSLTAEELQSGIDGIDEALSEGDTGVSESTPQKKTKTLRAGTKKVNRKIKDPNAIKALNIESNSPYDRVMQYFIKNGQIHPSALHEIFGGPGREKKVGKEIQAKLNIVHKGTGLGLEELAHKLSESHPEGQEHITSQDYMDAVEQVLLNHNNKDSMTKAMLEKHAEKADEMSDIDKAYYDGLHEQEQAFVGDAVDYWHELTKEEQEFLANESEANIETFVEEKTDNSVLVFHGGEVESSKSFRKEKGNFYVSESRSQARHYADGNGGKVKGFLLDKSKIVDESVVLDIIKELNLSPKNKEWTIDDSSFFELMDERFEQALSHSDIKKVVAELEKRGYEAVEFTDVDVTGKSRTIQNMLILDPKKSLSRGESFKPSITSKAAALAKKIRESGKYFDDKATSSPPLLRAAWKAAHEAAALAIEGGAEVVEATKKAIEVFKETEFYKSLSDKGKGIWEKDIVDSLNKEEAEPPVEKPPVKDKTEGENPENKNTGLTHEAVDKDRKKLGLEPVDKMSFDAKKDFEEASAEYKETHIETAQKLAASRTPATRKQTYVISLGIVDLKAKLDAAKNRMVKAIESGDEKAKQEAYVDIELNRTNLDVAHQALKNASSEAGRVLRAVQDSIKEDMSLENTIRTAKAYSKDGKLTPAEQKTFEDITTKLEAAEKALKEHEEAKSKAEAQKVIDDLAVEEKINKGVEAEVEKISAKLPSSRRVAANKAIAALDGFQKKIRANNYSSVPVAIIDTAITTVKLAIKAGVEVADAVELGINKVKELYGKQWDKEDMFRNDMLSSFKREGVNTTSTTKVKISESGKIKGLNKIVKGFVERGITDINEIVKEIKKDVPDMTEREIRDEISGYGKVTELSNDPINIELRKLKRIGKLITQKENVLANEALLRSGLQRDKPTAKEVELQKEINDIMRENQMKTEQIPKTDAQWKTLLDKYKDRLRKKEADLQEKYDRNDFETKKRALLKHDPESLELKARVDKQMEARKKAIEKIRLANRTPFEKVADTITKALRFAILTGVVTPALKLGVGAGLMRSAIMNPLETLATASWSHLPGLRKIAEQAPRYSGAQIKPMAKGISEWWSKGMAADVKRVATGGKLEMDILYGKNDGQPATLWDIWGQFHKILKTPAKRAEFATSMEMNLNWEARQKNELGEFNDINDPNVQLRAALRALNDSDRAIFMQDNFLSSGYKMMLKGWERKLDDGSKAGEVLAKMAQMEMLIVKVPTNFVAEGLSYLPGGGAAKALTSIISLRKSLDKLKPEQADYISRAISKQMVGAATFGIGYYLYKNMGGNYVPDQTNKEKPKSGEMKIGDWHVPHALQHSVFVESIQLGATMAWAEDFYKKQDVKKGVDEGHHLDGYQTMVKSLVKKLPYVQEADVLMKELNSTTDKSMLTASLISKIESPAKWFADHFDTDANGNKIERKPQTWLDVLKMPIPGLRQQVISAYDLAMQEQAKLSEDDAVLAQIEDEYKQKNPDEKKISELQSKLHDQKAERKTERDEKVMAKQKGFIDLGKAIKGSVPYVLPKSLTKEQRWKLIEYMKK